MARRIVPGIKKDIALQYVIHVFQADILTLGGFCVIHRLLRISRRNAVIFNIDKETLPREDIEALQLRRLQDLCSRVYANVPFYRKRFDESGIKPGDIKSLADLKNLPFTEKQDLRNYYPFGLFAVPRDNIVRLHASSGTTGKAVVVGYTARDLHNWAELAGRSLSAAGVNQTDIVHVAYAVSYTHLTLPTTVLV